MATARSAARRALDELLADGQWHDRDTAVRAIAPHVPPGQAIREANRMRTNQRNRRGNTDVNPNLSHTADDQHVGARATAYEVVRSAVRTGRIQARTTETGTLIRKAP